MRFWLSWQQEGEDYRPVKWPPPDGVLAFWCSGFAGDLSYSCVVAIVDAPNEAKAKSIITKAWKPGVGEWRFCREYGKDEPPGDRFPAPEWSVELGRWPWPVVEEG